MKLELKHLAAYLPYDLGLSGCQSKLSGRIIERWQNDDFDIVPCLRPMGDLTKEIDVNGEKFVPIAELLKIKYPYKGDYNDKYASITIDSIGYPHACYSYMATKDIMINPNDYQNLPYWIIQKLLEWNFDIFGLIPANLAIDINTI